MVFDDGATSCGIPPLVFGLEAVRVPAPGAIRHAWNRSDTCVARRIAGRGSQRARVPTDERSARWLPEVP